VSNDGKSKNYSIDGIGTIMTKWSNLQHFKGDIGKLFNETLDNDEKATWYILNFSPYALSDHDDMQVILNAAKSSTRHIKIKWAFQTPQVVLQNNFSQLMLYFLLPDIQKTSKTYFVDKLYICKNIENKFSEVESPIMDKFDDVRKNLSIYASQSPTFYFAWISVPETKEKLDIDSEEFNAPKGTFGFVMLYGHLAEYDDRPAIYFDKAQSERKWPILNFYVASTLRFFDYGLLPPSNSNKKMANTPYLFELNVEDKKKAENKWLLQNIKCP
jgi:hypothetical protein